MLAADVAKAILEELGVITLGDAPDATEQDLCLRRVKTMLDRWSAKQLNVYALTEESFPLTVGKNPYTIGMDPTGQVIYDFNTQRPVSILYARLRDAQNVDHLLDVNMTEGYYDGLWNKTTNRRPIKLWLDHQFPVAKVVFDAPPDNTYTLFMSSQKALNTVSLADNPNTDLSGPEGYEAAMIYGGAVECADSFRKSPSQLLMDKAQDALKTLKNNNTRIEPHRFDPAFFNSWRRGGLSMR